jgi:hypothetical protein
VGTAIVLSAALTLNGLAPITPQAHYCLRLVREVIEHAYQLPPGAFYARYWTHKVEENATSEPWARDLERSLRAAGLTVTTPRAGDLVFNHRVAHPYGHAGIMLSSILVLDVWPNATGPPLRLTPVWEWAPTTIIRLPEEW